MKKLSTIYKIWVKHFSYLLLLLFSMSFFTQSAFAQTPPSIKTLKNEYYLFMVTAKSAEAILDPKNNTYILTMDEVDPTIVYFSNVPKYEADLMDITDFSSVIVKNIDHYHPNGLNAGLVGAATLNNDHQIKKYILALRNPVYNADKKTLKFSAVMAPLNPNTHEKHTDNFPSHIQLKNASLFIDSVCLSCIQP